METQTCYVCGKFFEDKVKLGLHLTPCYNEAVSVRKELWHPHPLDLVDEQRYTEYMKNRFKERENQIQDARNKGVSFVTADNFEAIRGSLGVHAQPVQRRSQPAPAACSDAPLHSAQIAQPVRVVATGVTMLRNELSQELMRIKEVRQSEEAQAAIRQQEFESLLNNFNALRGAPIAANPTTATPSAPLTARQVESSPVVPPVPPPAPSQATQLPIDPHHPSQQPMHVPTTSGQGCGAVLLDGRIQCGTCGKLFGKKGFEVHAQRCYRGAEDFTYSRDARFERNYPTPNQPVPQLQDPRYAPAPGGGGASAGGDDQWTQFMMTYPRPVLDEKPKTAKERNQAAVDAAKKAEYQKMVAQEMGGGGPAPPSTEQREPTVPCGKCGRYFYASRVGRHEATCVSKPKK